MSSGPNLPSRFTAQPSPARPRLPIIICATGPLVQNWLIIPRITRAAPANQSGMSCQRHGLTALHGHSRQGSAHPRSKSARVLATPGQHPHFGHVGTQGEQLEKPRTKLENREVEPTEMLQGPEHPSPLTWHQEPSPKKTCPSKAPHADPQYCNLLPNPRNLLPDPLKRLRKLPDPLALQRFIC